jgi:hypothetical protein
MERGVAGTIMFRDRKDAGEKLALALAALNGNEKRAEQIRCRIDLYNHKKPYLQPPPPTH